MIKMKKLMSIMTIIFIVLLNFYIPNVSAEDVVYNIGLEASAGTLKSGDNVTITVNVDNSPLLNCFQYDLIIDPNVFNVNNNKNPKNGLPYFCNEDWCNAFKSTSGLLTIANYKVEENTIVFVAVGTKNISTNEIGKFNLTVKKDINIQSTQIDLTSALIGTIDYSKNRTVKLLISQPSGLKLDIAGIPGDVTKDGNVDSNDAVWILQYIENNRIFDDNQIVLADFNNDNVIDEIDAKAILDQELNL